VRTALLLIALAGFAGLAVIDLMAGNWRIGIPALLLVIVNGMLLA
jgi:hypothetical protein